jgi:hypothetical protein
VKKWLIGFTIMGMTGIGLPSAHAWDSFGHRLVVAIAYKQLDEATRQRVAAALQGHPALDSELWKRLGTGDPSPAGLVLFMNAATFPDDVRPDRKPDGSIDNRFHVPEWSTLYHRSSNHFINYRFEPPSTLPGAPPGSSGEDIVSAFAKHSRTVRDFKASADVDEARQRAVSLSWMMHLAGDVHQPLHCTARFSSKYHQAHGDEGGNAVKPFPNPRASAAYDRNLHAYWDDLLGSNRDADSPGRIVDVADDIIASVPPGAFTADQLKPTTDIRLWALESFGLAVDKAYLPLGDLLDRTEPIGEDDVPDDYEARSKDVARKQVALAGYRLAEVLKATFPADGDGR